MVRIRVGIRHRLAWVRNLACALGPSIMDIVGYEFQGTVNAMSELHKPGFVNALELLEHGSLYAWFHSPTEVPAGVPIPCLAIGTVFATHFEIGLEVNQEKLLGAAIYFRINLHTEGLGDSV